MCIHRKGGIQAVCIDCNHQTETQRMARVLVSWSHSLMKKLQGKRNASAHQLFRSACSTRRCCRRSFLATREMTLWLESWQACPLLEQHLAFVLLASPRFTKSQPCCLQAAAWTMVQAAMLVLFNAGHCFQHHVPTRSSTVSDACQRSRAI